MIHNMNVIKKHIKLILYLAIVTLALLSCSQEKVLPHTSEAGVPVTILFEAGTRATVDGDDPAECQIGNFNVLIYNSKNNMLMWNFPITQGLPDEHLTQTLDIRTGTYDFVFIANANELYNGSTPVSLSVDSQVNHFSKLSNLSVDRDDFGFGKDIPMVRYYKNIEVAMDNKIKSSEMSDFQAGPWSIEMERVAIKLDLKIVLTELQFLNWDQKITIKNVPGKAYLFSEKDNSSFEKAFDLEIDIVSGSLSSVPYGDDYVLITSEKPIILPELYLTPAHNVAQKSMVLEMVFSGVAKSAHISCEADNYAIPRNTTLTLNATVKEDEIDLVAQLLPWGDAGIDEVDFDGQYRFMVDQSEVTFTHLGGSQTIELFTDYPGGWKVEGVTSSGWIVSPTTATFGGPNSYTPLLIACMQNFGTEDRTGFVVIRAGNLLKKINVTQLAAK